MYTQIVALEHTAQCHVPFAGYCYDRSWLENLPKGWYFYPSGPFDSWSMENATYEALSHGYLLSRIPGPSWGCRNLSACDESSEIVHTPWSCAQSRDSFCKGRHPCHNSHKTRWNLQCISPKSLCTICRTLRQVSFSPKMWFVKEVRRNAKRSLVVYLLRKERRKTWDER